MSRFKDCKVLKIKPDINQFLYQSSSTVDHIVKEKVYIRIKSTEIKNPCSCY
jgi:hypothetical protein